MTSQSPRIYTYKITFEEVPYYYYGIHKERRFDEEYWGSPKTHRWCWELYTPRKQILEIFDYTDAGWLEAQEVEKKIIQEFYNSDKWCLNESCGGRISLNVLRENGKNIGNIMGKKNVETGHIQNLGIIYGNIHKENKTGVCGLSKEELIENGRKSGYKTYEMRVGVHGMTSEQRSEASRKGGRKGGKISGKIQYELKIGIHSISKEERIKIGKKSMEKINAQRWMCLETGYITNAGALSRYQKKRGIDTSKRLRLY